MNVSKSWSRQIFIVVVLILIHVPVLGTISAQNGICVDLLPSPWSLVGNNGDAQQYGQSMGNILNGMEFIRVTYDLHGIVAIPGDASAIIFDQNGWRYASLANYGQNGLNGSQTVDIPISHFQENGNILNPAQPVGTLHTRFWYGSAFTVDIYSIKACRSQPVFTATLLPTSTPSITATNTIPPTSTPTVSPTNTTVPTSTSTVTNAPTATTVVTAAPTSTSTGVVIPPLPPGGVELLSQPWRLIGNSGDAQQFQSIPANVLNDKDTIRVTYDLHGLMALPTDASALIFNQGGWRYASLANFGQNGLNGVQTVHIPISQFQENGNVLNPNQNVGNLQVRFWYGSAFTVDIYSVVAYSSQAPTTVPTNTPVPTVTQIASATPILTLPAPWTSVDVGSPAVSGSASFNNGVFTIAGAGSDIWSNSDQFRYVYIPANGDGQITARLLSQTNTNDWAKAGIIIKQNTSALTSYVLMSVTPRNGVAFQWNFSGNSNGRSYTFPTWVRLVKRGVQIEGYESQDGQSWTLISSASVSLTNSFTVGLFVTSHDSGRLGTATFDNVQVSFGQPSATQTPSNTPTTAVSTATPSSQFSVVIDNLDIGFASQVAWTTSTYDAGYYGSNYFHDGSADPSSANWARWTPNLPSPGLYNIYMRWTSSANRPDAAPVQIEVSGSIIATLTVNQQQNSASWVNLGQFYLAGGGSSSVRLLTTDAGYTIADAVRFDLVASAPATLTSTRTFTAAPTQTPQPTATLVPSATPALPMSTPVPVQPSAVPTFAQCPSGTGPDGITAGGYNPQKLTEDQRQWLFNLFGNVGTAPVGYGGQSCNPDYGSGDENFRAYVCRRAQRGPDGILPGGYNPQSLTQDQRNWLFQQFGNQGTAPVGYGGESCPVAPIPQCPSGLSPGGYPAGSYPPESLPQVDRQWLWEQFYHTGTAPVGYGGERCNRGNAAPIPPCPSGVGAPGGYNPTTLTQQQRNELYWAFGHTGQAPVGYGGEACYGGTMTLPSFSQPSINPTATPFSASPVPLPNFGSITPIGSVSVRVTAAPYLNIRNAPNLEASIIGKANTNVYLQVVAGPLSGWYQVNLGGTFGWISQAYTQIVIAPDFSESQTAAASAQMVQSFDIGLRLPIGVEAPTAIELPILGYSIWDIGNGIRNSRSSRTLIAGPGAGILCLGVGLARSDNPAIQRAIDAGDITCTYVQLGAAVIAVGATGGSVAASVGLTAAVYPILINPDRYIGTVFRNQVELYVTQGRMQCEIAEAILGVDLTIPPFC